MAKSNHTEDVPHPGDRIRIPLPEDEALRLFAKVKPTKDTPRAGTMRKKAAKSAPKQPAKKRR